jgi:hypothetical protein
MGNISHVTAAPIEIVETVQSANKIDKNFGPDFAILQDPIRSSTVGADFDADGEVGQYTVKNTTDESIFAFGISNPGASPITDFQNGVSPSYDILTGIDNPSSTTENISVDFGGPERTFPRNKLPADVNEDFLIYSCNIDPDSVAGQSCVTRPPTSVLPPDVPLEGTVLLRPGETRSDFFFEPARLASTGFALTGSAGSSVSSLSVTSVDVTQIPAPSTVICLFVGLVTVATFTVWHRLGYAEVDTSL